MKSIVSIAVDGRIDIPVETPDGLDQATFLKIARDEALTNFMFADLTKMEVVGTNAVNVTLPDGKLLDYD